MRHHGTCRTKHCWPSARSPAHKHNLRSVQWTPILKKGSTTGTPCYEGKHNFSVQHTSHTMEVTRKQHLLPYTMDDVVGFPTITCTHCNGKYEIGKVKSGVSILFPLYLGASRTIGTGIERHSITPSPDSRKNGRLRRSSLLDKMRPHSSVIINEFSK